MSEFYNASTIAAKLNLKSPWLLLDYAEKNDDTHFTGFKNFTVNEKFFTGHFPSHPIVPGVLQVETVRQLALLFAPGDATQWHIRKISKVKFRRQVLPGDRMRVEAEVISSTADELQIKASCITASGACSDVQLTLGAATYEPAHLNAIPAVNGEYERNADIFMDTDKVMSLMPHRYPFLLIDYIAKVEDSIVTAIKNVSINEEFFNSGFTTIPEVLLCEIGAQSSCASILARPENAGKLGFFMAIENAVFYRPVYPGDQMIIKADLPAAGKSKFGKGSGKIYVGDELVFEITLMFAIVDA